MENENSVLIIKPMEDIKKLKALASEPRIQILTLIKNAGGKAILAHPKLIKNDAKVLELIESGIDGLEAYYPEHNADDTQKYLTIAKKCGLIATGGSDFHGFTARHAIDLGEFTVTDSIAERLINAD